VPTSPYPLLFDGFAQDALSVDTFSFKLKFVAQVGSEEIDITDSVTAVSIWFGEIATGVYGWSISLSGVNYNRYVYAVGNRIDVYRTITLPASYGWTPTEDLWYTGYIMPSSVQTAYQTNTWSAQVVDKLTFLSLRQSPVIAVGRINVATNGAATADSEAVPEIIANQQEFVGRPSLSAGRAVDGDKSSLWVSTNAPERGTMASIAHPRVRVSEVYSRPNPSLSLKEHQWIELAKNSGPDQQIVTIMTRSSMISVDVSFGEPLENTEEPKPSFAVLSYDGDTFSEVWGTAPNHCPHFEWKNAGWQSIWWTGEDGRDFGFNLDGQGDYIALYGNDYGPGGRGSHTWVTNLVVDGPKMQRSSQSTTGGGVVSLAPGGTAITVDLNEEWGEDELEGCFIECNWGAATGYNKVRHIASNTASTPVGSFHRVTITPSQPWIAYNSPWNYLPEAGHTVRISSYPRSGRELGAWSGAAVDEQPALSSLRLINYLPDPLDASSWEEDETPQIGYSGAHSDPSTWSWISVKPQDMVFYLSSSLLNGDQVVNLQGTAGLKPAGAVFIGVAGPFDYIEKTNSTITLDDPWSGSTVPAGTQVYQDADGATTAWPIAEVAVVRRQVPRLDNPAMYRVIQNIAVFGSNELSPLYPGEENWQNDWDELFITDNNTSLTRLSWNPLLAIRYRHYLFCIKSMSDESQGRANEIELLMPDSTLGNVLSNQTATSFLVYILTVMGINEEDIVVNTPSTMQIGAFSTDTSSYASVLSDLATRTGYIVVCAPNGIVTIYRNPNWWPAGPLVSIATLGKSEIKRLPVELRDDLSISQVEVTIEDEDDTGIGIFPPIPRQAGSVYKEPQVFSARLQDANTVARWLLAEKTSPLIQVSLVGPATWAMGGAQIVDLEWDEEFGLSGPDVQGRWVIRGTQHQIQFGNMVSPASWETSIMLQKKT